MTDRTEALAAVILDTPPDLERESERGSAGQEAQPHRHEITVAGWRGAEIVQTGQAQVTVYGRTQLKGGLYFLTLPWRRNDEGQWWPSVFQLRLETFTGKTARGQVRAELEERSDALVEAVRGWLNRDQAANADVLAPPMTAGFQGEATP